MDAQQQSGRILIVEDEESIRLWLRRLLSRHGYVVSEAANLSGALDIIDDQPLDLAIFDMILPEKQTGLKLLRYLRAHPTAAGVPAMILTGRDLLPEEEEEARVFKAHVVLKPVDSKELVSLIERLIAARQVK